ncbi:MULTISPECIES: hypothetical protein [unclassified Rhizobium]|jgi:hypothetical protein|uniref:hypothetical protein n=1 Tax=unclassified Rhizobium TaxID=2613769 RepID=UPI0006903BA5|nr:MULTISPECIES: hypothetical protein [unclassified Rhizobium]MBN8952335.1 hypothetical protein [Rhizobium tropici]OJY79729.1 MAG: hypothetical protein BGP09_07265 [Rhizobium sp. 60-20]RKD66938.1 hypothetical protein BJ928_106469 [Rhizobium sp. WW_1]
MHLSKTLLFLTAIGYRSVTGKGRMLAGAIGVCLTASLLSVLASSLSEARPLAGPAGHYCGKLYSNGLLVDVETSLHVDMEGHVSGTYRFDDDGTKTIGTLSEIGVAPGTKRVLLWFDKYGTGALSVQFDPGYTHFDGLWGPHGSLPSYTWNGGNCNAPIS